MNGNRERDIIDAFVELSHELVDDYDVVEMLSRLTTSCAALLDVASAGLLLADSSGVLHLAASSSERIAHLELFQLQRDEGPCLDCYHSGEAITVPDLEAAEHRWPQFVAAARAGGHRSVHALPMRLRGHRLGTLGLFGTTVGDLNAEDLGLAQAMVHVASVAIVNEKAASDRNLINAQLQRALTSRIVLEQAKGVLAQSGDLAMGDAFNLLRGYARDHGLKLSDLAAEVVERRLRIETLLAHAGAGSSRS
ncbi:GAF and ANTAR domain-containing protein [Nocardioides sp. 1609]|uniref:GAF and ANTAR domain-containing protein n=1 Tax=Nocardioides sp. 1609 TaxID=2508327 RepID=UPI0010700C74|nr:GAF and ANTAR domain-containing protein [Nocardioides sp. 1609]